MATDKKLDKDDLEKKLDGNECPIKDKNGNCLIPGIYSDSDPIGGG